MDKDKDLAYFSNYGDSVLFGAPGVKIYSTYKGDSYKVLNGTSMASPHIAGVVSLLKELKPELSNEQIKELMLKNRGKNKYVDVSKIIGGEQMRKSDESRGEKNKGMTEDLVGGLSEDKNKTRSEKQKAKSENKNEADEKTDESRGEKTEESRQEQINKKEELKEENKTSKDQTNQKEETKQEQESEEEVNQKEEPEYKLTEEEKRKIEEDLKKKNGIQIDILELGGNQTGENVKINSVEGTGSKIPNKLPNEEELEELNDYYVNTGAVINLNLLGTGTTQINSDQESEIKIEQTDKEPELEKEEEKIPENLTGEELKNYLEKEEKPNNVKINSLEEKQEYILEEETDLTGESLSGINLTGEILREKEKLKKQEIEVNNILAETIQEKEEKAPITKGEIEKLEKERKQIKINSEDEENSPLILEEETNGTEINSTEQEQDNQVYEILPSIQTGEKETIGVANSYYRTIKVGSYTRVYVPRARSYRYYFSSRGKIRMYRRGNRIKIYGVRPGRTTVYFKRRGRTYHRITVNVIGNTRKSLSSLSWKYVNVKEGNYARFRLPYSRRYRVYKTNNNVRIYKYRYGLRIVGLRKGITYVYIKDRGGNRRYKIKVRITENIRPLRLSKTNIIVREGYHTRIRIYDGNGNYKAYYDRNKINTRIYSRGRYGRIKVEGKRTSLGTNYLTIKDAKNQRKNIRYEVIPKIRTYRIKLTERENGYVNINYAGNYTFRINGTDKISLYKERNRVRIYGKKAGTVRIYIYYKNYYIGKIEVKVEQSYKVITIKKKIYINKWLRISVRNGRRYDVLRYDRNKIYVYKRIWSNGMRVYGKREGKTELWLRSRYENVDYRIILDIVKPKPFQVSPTPTKIKVGEEKEYNVSYEKWVRVRTPRRARNYIEAKIENGKLILKGKKAYKRGTRVLIYDGLRRWRRFNVKVEENKVEVIEGNNKNINLSLTSVNTNTYILGFKLNGGYDFVGLANSRLKKIVSIDNNLGSGYYTLVLGLNDTSLTNLALVLKKGNTVTYYRLNNISVADNDDYRFLMYYDYLSTTKVVFNVMLGWFKAKSKEIFENTISDIKEDLSLIKNKDKYYKEYLTSKDATSRFEEFIELGKVYKKIKELNERKSKFMIINTFTIPYGKLSVKDTRLTYLYDHRPRGLFDVKRLPYFERKEVKDKKGNVKTNQKVLVHEKEYETSELGNFFVGLNGYRVGATYDDLVALGISVEILKYLGKLLDKYCSVGDIKCMKNHFEAERYDQRFYLIGYYYGLLEERGVITSSNRGKILTELMQWAKGN